MSETSQSYSSQGSPSDGADAPARGPLPPPPLREGFGAYPPVVAPAPVASGATLEYQGHGAGMLAFQAPAAPPVVPPGGVIYKVDSSRATFGELRRDTKSIFGAVIIGISKLLRVRLPGSVNDPNVQSLRPFEVAAVELPQDVRDRMAPALRDLAGVGFDVERPICHAIVDLFNNSRLYVVAVPREDGRALGRVFVRTEGASVPPKTHFYTDLLTGLGDGRFVWTTGAKATCKAPDGIAVHRHVAAPPAELWAFHEREIAALEAGGRVKRAVARAEVVELIESHHARVRDFHLARRLFSPLTEADRQNATAIDAAYGRAAAGGSAYPEVLAEMERLQKKSGGWVGGVMVLVVSLLVFIGAGLPGAGGSFGDKESRSWEALLLLVPILLFHELGHYLAMRIFGYRNVRMFFIPFLGAAVTGQNYSAPGWKKAIVSLMGPIPGIAVGTVLAIAGMVMNHAMLMKVALMTLILNGFNLLPVLPLDGGRVVQTLFFSRHYALDVAFRALAAVALLGLSAAFGDRVFMMIGIVMLLGLPIALRQGRVAAQLRREGLAPPVSDATTIAPGTAEAIIGRVKASFPKIANASNKSVAENSLAVYEAVCNRPPGWGATIGFSLLHGGAIVVALVMAMLVAVAQPRGGLRGLAGLARMRQTEPANKLALTDIARVDGPVAAGRPTARRTVYANFPKPEAARAAFEDLRSQVGAGESLQRFGQTLMVSLSAADDAARRRWLAALEGRTREVAVDGGEMFGGMGMSLSCVAPDAATATRIEEEASAYLGMPDRYNLVAPWTPGDARTADERARHDTARRTYLRLQSAGSRAFDDPAARAIGRKISAASRRGDRAEMESLQRQQAVLHKAARDLEIQRVRDGVDGGGVDPFVVDAYVAMSAARPGAADSVDDDEAGDDAPGGDGAGGDPFDDPRHQIMAARMGQFAPIAPRPRALAKAAATTTPTATPTAAPTTRTATGSGEARLPRTIEPPAAVLAAGERRFASHFGSVHREGTRVRFAYVSFVDPTFGAPALVRWLSDRGVSGVKYEFPLPRSGEGADEVEGE